MAHSIKSEHDIVAIIINACQAHGWGVLRINGTRMRTPNVGFVNGYIAYPGRLVTGAPDLLIFSAGTCVFLECKTEIGKLTRAQRNFRTWAEHHGMTYLVARSDEVVKDLILIFNINFNS